MKHNLVNLAMSLSNKEKAIERIIERYKEDKCDECPFLMHTLIFKEALKSLPFGVSILDYEGNTILWNEAIHEFLNVPIQASSLPEKWGEYYKVYHKDDKSLSRPLPLNELPAMKCIKSHKTVKEVIRFGRKDLKSSILATLTCIPLFKDSMLVGVLAIFTHEVQ